MGRAEKRRACCEILWQFDGPAPLKRLDRIPDKLMTLSSKGPCWAEDVKMSEDDLAKRSRTRFQHGECR